MTVGRMLREMSAAEFRDWQDFISWEAQERKDAADKQKNQRQATDMRQRARGHTR